METERCEKQVPVEAVVVHYRHPALTRSCLQALARQSHGPLGVTLVDNGSSDLASDVMASEHPTVRVLRESANLGFAGASNRALREVLLGDAHYAWLLNNDTEPDAHALEAMVQVAESAPAIGAVGSILTDVKSGSVKAWGGGVVNLFTGLSREVCQPVAPAILAYLSGASLLIRKEALTQVGLLDEGFFLYWEDVDFCFRLRKGGWGLAVAEHSRVGHHESASAGFLTPSWDHQFVLSSWRFFHRHAPLPILPFLSGSLIRAVLRARRGHWHNVSAIGRAVQIAFKGNRNSPVARGLEASPDPELELPPLQERASRKSLK